MNILTICNEVSVRDAIEHPDAYFQSACLFTVRDGFTNGCTDGNTLYNVFRSNAVRRAKVPCRLWHWVPVKGRYYMGLVMVDSPGGAETVAVSMREQPLGTIVADRGDGQRHLYVFEQPFDFEYAETLEVTTPADDRPYVIEGFLFTPFRPEEKEIVLAAAPDLLRAAAFESWMLPEAVTIRNPAGVSGEQGLARFSLTLPGLRAEDLVARDEAGTELPLDLVPLTADPKGVPMTQQVQVLLPLTGRREQTVRLARGQPSPHARFLRVSADERGVVLQAGPRKVAVTAGADGLEIRGLLAPPLRLLPGLTGVGGDTAAVAPLRGPVVGSASALAAEVDAAYRLNAADIEVEVEIVLRFDALLGAVEVDYGFTVTGPEKFNRLRDLTLHLTTPAAAGGTPRSRGGAQGAAPLPREGSLSPNGGTHVPALAGRGSAAAPSLMTDRLPAGLCFWEGADRREGQAFDLRAVDHPRVEVRTPDGRVERVPFLRWAGNRWFGVAAAEFTELHPAGLAVGPAEVVFHILPADFTPPELPTHDRDRLFFWVADGAYTLRRGMMRRRRLVICPRHREDRVRLFHDPLEAPLPRRRENGGLWYQPGPTAPGLAEFIARTVAAWNAQQAATQAYGLWNYGDWFGERGENWGNGEYDTSGGWLHLYALTGDADCRRIGMAAARHQLEVDTIHAGTEWVAWQYPHCMGHVGGYFPRGYRVGAYPDDVTPNEAHTWVEGMLLYYQLTGDRVALQTARRLLDDLAGPALEGKYFSNGRDVGWHLVHLVEAAAALRSPAYLEGAGRLVTLALARQRQDGSWRRVLHADHCTCYPHHTGNAGFMIGILLQSLCRYHELTGERQVEDCIRRGARFLIESLLDPQTGRLRYTSCPLSEPTSMTTSVHVVGALVHALRFAGTTEDERRQCRELVARFFEDYNACLAEPFHATRFSNVHGKAISKTLRFVPTFLDLGGR